MENFSPDLDAVIFDMDGTLIDTETLGAASWDHAGEDTGIWVTEETKQKMVGRNLRDIQRIVAEDLPGQDVDHLLDRANFHYHRLVTEQVPPVKRGAVALLERLKAAGIPLALATSSMSWQAEDKLGRTELRDYFDFLIGGDQIEQGKPHPEIFLHAAEGLKVSIRRSAVIEDSAPGIEAARRSGAKAVLVPEHWPAALEMAAYAHKVFPDLEHVEGWLFQDRNGG
jgi:HAD superfamily hydrolase (TIGR01509 family)